MSSSHPTSSYKVPPQPTPKDFHQEVFFVAANPLAFATCSQTNTEVDGSAAGSSFWIWKSFPEEFFFLRPLSYICLLKQTHHDKSISPRFCTHLWSLRWSGPRFSDSSLDHSSSFPTRSRRIRSLRGLRSVNAH